MKKTWQEINGVIGKSKNNHISVNSKMIVVIPLLTPKKFVMNLTISL